MIWLVTACTSMGTAAPPTPAAGSTPAPSATLLPSLTPAPSATPDPNIASTWAPVPVQFIYHGSRALPHVALTFDVCQDPAYPAGFDAAIVQQLVETNTPATFFMGGDWMRTHPQETALLGSYPFFELGNHSWSHPDLRSLSDEALDLEIVQTQDLLYLLTGRQGQLFRLPYGYGDERVLNAIAAHGLYTIQWDVETGDPDPNFSAETIRRAVREGVQNGSIIIMHANGRGWHTAEALPGILEELGSRGFVPVTVTELLGEE